MKQGTKQTTGKQLTKKNLQIHYVTKETFLGLGIIVGFQILKNIFVYFYYIYLFHHLSVKTFANRIKHPDPVMGGVLFLLSVLSIGSFIFGGFLGGKNAKKQAWIAGAIVGICWDILILLYALVSTILANFFPHFIYGPHATAKQIADFQKSLPLRYAYAFIFAFLNFSIPLTALGGWLEERYKRT